MIAWSSLIVVLTVCVFVAYALLTTRSPAVALGRFTVPLERPLRARDLLSWPLLGASVALIVAAVFGGGLHFGGVPALWSFAPLMAFNTLVAPVIAWGLARERWALPQAEAERALPLQIRRRRLVSHFTQAMTLLANLWLAVQWIAVARGWMRVFLVTAPVVPVSILILSLVFLVPLGRVQRELNALGGAPGLGTQTRGWKWGGLIYYAPDDPSILVPKRTGIGQTLNFARPQSWVFFGVLVVLVVITLLRVRP